MLAAGMRLADCARKMPLSSQLNFLPKSHVGVEIVPSAGQCGSDEFALWWLHGHVGMEYG